MNKAIIFAFLAVVVMAGAPAQAVDLPMVGGLWPMVEGLPLVGGIVGGELGLIKSVPVVGGMMDGSKSSSSSSSMAQSSSSSSSGSRSGSGSVV